MLRGRKISYIVIVSAVALMIISGCVSTPPETTPTPTPVVTPTPTPVPTTGTSVEVLKAPDTAEAGKSFEISWRVNSPVVKNISHTAVHYGPESKSEPLTLVSYPNLTTPQGGNIPADFSANITISKAGVIYYRAHVIIDGGNYWAPEMTITITAPSNVSMAVNATPTVTATTSTGRGYGY